MRPPWCAHQGTPATQEQYIHRSPTTAGPVAPPQHAHHSGATHPLLTESSLPRSSTSASCFTAPLWLYKCAITCACRPRR